MSGSFDYAKTVTDAEAKYGIPDGIYERLLSQGERSGAAAVSPKGAIGYAQLMPATARDMGVDPWNPEQNIGGGAKYLKWLYDQTGDWTKSVAAYNAGLGRVRQAGGVPDIRETQDYVRRVMGGGMPTTTPGAAAPGLIDPKTTELLNQQADTAFKEMQGANADAAKDVQTAGAGIRSVISDEQAARNQPLPMPARMRDLPPPPDPHDYMKDPTKVLQQTLPLLAILGGLGMRNGSLAAMKASAAAMKASKSNDEEALQQAHDQWKDAMETTLKSFDMEQQHFHDIMENRQMSQQERLGELQAWAAASGNAQTLAQIKSGDFNAVWQQRQMLEASASRAWQVYNQSQQIDLERDRVKAENLKIENERKYHEAYVAYLQGKPDNMQQMATDLEKKKLQAKSGQKVDGKPVTFSTDEQATLDRLETMINKGMAPDPTAGTVAADGTVPEPGAPGAPGVPLAPNPKPPAAPPAARKFPAAPPQAVAELKKLNTPENRKHFDAVFGPGAAAKALSGV